MLLLFRMSVVLLVVSEFFIALNAGIASANWASVSDHRELLCSSLCNNSAQYVHVISLRDRWRADSSLSKPNVPSINGRISHNRCFSESSFYFRTLSERRATYELSANRGLDRVTGLRFAYFRIGSSLSRTGRTSSELKIRNFPSRFQNGRSGSESRDRSKKTLENTKSAFLMTNFLAAHSFSATRAREDLAKESTRSPLLCNSGILMSGLRPQSIRFKPMPTASHSSRALASHRMNRAAW